MEPVKATQEIFGNAPAHEAGTLAPETQKVLRNTYMLLAMTMVPTLAGAWLGMKTGSIIMASPIISVIVMLGALLFMTSDSIIGETRFVGPRRHERIAIMTTYHLGQILLILSLVR